MNHDTAEPIREMQSNNSPVCGDVKPADRNTTLGSGEWLPLALFILGWAVAVRGWKLTAGSHIEPVSPKAAVRHSIVLTVLAGFIVLRYLPGIPAAFANESIPKESLADPAMFWSTFLMDLGIFVPIVLATAVGLHRGAPWALRALYMTVGWFVLVTLAVLAMSIVLVVNDDPHAAGVQIAVFGVTAVSVVGYAASLFRSLMLGGSGPRSVSGPENGGNPAGLVGP